MTTLLNFAGLIEIYPDTAERTQFLHRAKALLEMDHAALQEALAQYEEVLAQRETTRAQHETTRVQHETTGVQHEMMRTPHHTAQVQHTEMLAQQTHEQVQQLLHRLQGTASFLTGSSGNSASIFHPFSKALRQAEIATGDAAKLSTLKAQVLGYLHQLEEAVSNVIRHPSL